MSSSSSNQAFRVTDSSLPEIQDCFGVFDETQSQSTQETFFEGIPSAGAGSQSSSQSTDGDSKTEAPSQSSSQSTATGNKKRPKPASASGRRSSSSVSITSAGSQSPGRLSKRPTYEVEEQASSEPGSQSSSSGKNKRHKTITKMSKAAPQIDRGVAFPIQPDDLQKATELYGIVPWPKTKTASVFTNNLFFKITARLECPDTTHASAMCRYCAQQYKADTATANLVYHLTKHHPEHKDKSPKPEGVEPPVTLTHVTLGTMATKKAAYNHKSLALLVEAVANGNFSMNHVCNPTPSQVESEDQDEAAARSHFAKFASYISDGKFTPPSRKTLTTAIRANGEDVQKRLKEKLAELGASFSPCLIADCWTSNAGDGYYGILVQFVDNNWVLQCVVLDVVRLLDNKEGSTLASIARNTCKQYGIEYIGCLGGTECTNADPVHTTEDTRHCCFSFTTDSGGGDPVSASLCACNPMRCVCHACNSVVSDLRKSQHPVVVKFWKIVDNLRTVIKHYRNSNKHSHILKATQKFVAHSDPRYTNSTPHTPTLDMEVRWNTTKQMIEDGATPFMETCYRQSVASSTTIADSKVGECLPSAEDFVFVRNAMPVLSELAVLSRFSEGEKYTTISAVWPLVTKLLSSLAKIVVGGNPGQDVCSAIAQETLVSFQKRLTKQFVKSATSVAMVLDPRSKHLAQIPPQSREGFWSALKVAAQDELERMRNEQLLGASVSLDVDAPNVERPAELEFSDDDDLFPVEVSDPEVTDSLDVDTEIAEYKKMPGQDSGSPRFRPDKDANPLDWWKYVSQVQQKLPILSRVARRYLAIPASSAAAERLFFYTGERVSKKSTSLGDDMLLYLTLIAKCRKFLA